MEFADRKEISRLDKELEKGALAAKKFVLKAEVQEKLRKVEKEIWEELALKLEKETFVRKFDDFEKE